MYTPDVNQSYNTNDSDVHINIEQFDMPISLEEMQNTISSLKRHTVIYYSNGDMLQKNGNR